MLRPRITLEQAASGYKTKLTIPRAEPCETCNGSQRCCPVLAGVCNMCSGARRVRFQQGFFQSVAPASSAGTGRVITSYCKTCRGQGLIEKEQSLEIKIPAGVDSGARLRVSGEGEAGTAGGPRGDLYVIIQVREHELFERQGNNLYVNVPISFAQAALGAQVTVPTLDGEDSLNIPAATQTGSIFRIKGQGIVSLQGQGRGDLFHVSLRWSLRRA